MHAGPKVYRLHEAPQPPRSSRTPRGTGPCTSFFHPQGPGSSRPPGPPQAGSSAKKTHLPLPILPTSRLDQRPLLQETHKYDVLCPQPRPLPPPSPSPRTPNMDSCIACRDTGRRTPPPPKNTNPVYKVGGARRNRTRDAPKIQDK